MVCVTVVHFVNQVASGLERQTLKCPPPVVWCLLCCYSCCIVHRPKTEMHLQHINYVCVCAITCRRYIALCMRVLHLTFSTVSPYKYLCTYLLGACFLLCSTTIYSLLCVFLLLHGDRWMLLAMLPTWPPKWGTSSWRQWFVWWRVCVAWQPIPALNMFMKRWHSSARCWRRWRRHNMP